MPFQAPRISFRRSAADLWLGHATNWLQRCVALVACVAALGVLAWVGCDWYARHRVLLEERERMASARTLFAAPKTLAKAAGPELNSIEIEQYNTAVGQLNTPWSEVFNGLERQVQPDIGLMVLEPDTLKGTLRVQAEAHDVEHLLIYARLVASDKAFGALNLQRHETNEQDPNRPARLSFEVRLANSSAKAGALK